MREWLRRINDIRHFGWLNAWRLRAGYRKLYRKWGRDIGVKPVMYLLDEADVWRVARQPGTAEMFEEFAYHRRVQEESLREAQGEVV